MSTLHVNHHIDIIIVIDWMSRYAEHTSQIRIPKCEVRNLREAGPIPDPDVRNA